MVKLYLCGVFPFAVILQTEIKIITIGIRGLPVTQQTVIIKCKRTLIGCAVKPVIINIRNSGGSGCIYPCCIIPVDYRFVFLRLPTFKYYICYTNVGVIVVLYSVGYNANRFTVFAVLIIYNVGVV